MNDQGKVEVELRLALEQMRKDVKTAADMLRTGLSGASGDVAAGTAKAGKEMEGLEKKTKKATDALKELKKAGHDAWKASLKEPQVRFVGSSATTTTHGPGAILNQGMKTVLPDQTPSGESAPGRGIGVGAPPRAFPVAGAATAVAAGAGTSMLGMLAQVGAVLAGVRAAMGILKFAINAVVAPLRMLAAAAEAAAKAYANALSQGIPLNFGIRTSMLASALGVGQQEVLQYGKAVQVLNDRMKFSILMMQETTRPLTQVGWNLKAAQASIAAYFSSLSSQMAPALNQFLGLVKNTMDALARSSIVAGLAWLAKELFHIANLLFGAVSLIVQAFELMVQAIVDSIQYFIRQVRNTIARYTHGTIDTTDVYKESKEKAEILARTFKDMMGRQENMPKTPEPSGNANRLMSSAWEKMGLVLGSGGPNHAAQTAANTKRIAGLMERMVQHFTGPGYTAGNQPASIPSTP